MANEKQLDLTSLLGDVRAEVETLAEFVASARTARQRISEVEPSQEFYLTECAGCCCDKTSYRFFAGMPLINRASGHADTGNKGFIVKVYNKPAGLSADLAEFILFGIEGVSPEEVRGTSVYGACYRV